MKRDEIRFPDNKLGTPCMFVAQIQDTWRDALVLAILATACLALRGPALGWVCANPDEAQYAAQGSYLDAHGASTFSIPIGTVHTYALYKWMTQLFGPYPMFEMRVLVLGIGFVMAVLIYFMAREAIGRFWALVATLLFVYYNVYFEGLSTNREWFSGALLLTGCWCYWRSWHRDARERFAWVAAAGLSCGTSLYFKEQAVYMALVVPAAIVLDGAAIPRAQTPRWTLLAAYALGVVLAVVGYAIPFFLAGSLAEHLRFQAGFRFDYVNAHTATTPVASLAKLYFHAFYLDLPFRRLTLVTYAATAVVLTAVARPALAARLGGTPFMADRTIRLFMLYFLAAVFAIQTGKRFFGHYYLYWMPPWTVLFACGMRALWQMPRKEIASGAVAAAAFAVLCLDLILLSPPQPHLAIIFENGMPLLPPIFRPWVEKPMAWAILALELVPAIIVCGLILATRKNEFLGQVVRRGVIGLVCGWLCIDLGRLVYDAQTNLVFTPPVSEVPQLIDYLRAHARPADRLFVWGWRPEIYAFSGLESATPFPTAMELMRDVDGVPHGDEYYDHTYSAQLMEALRRRPPRWIVDASRRSIHPAVYRLEHYPPLGEFLRQHYVLAATPDACPVYLLRPQKSPADGDAGRHD